MWVKGRLMTTQRPNSATKSEAQAARRAQALRENLKRRKEQAKGREQNSESKDHNE
jgi:hypothetical protein